MANVSKSQAKKQRDALVDLLLREYRLDPGAIEYLLEEARSLGADVPVQLACSALEGDPTPDQLENVGEFVRRSAREPAIKRAFERPTKKLGRCPPSRRRWLGDHAAPKSAPAPPFPPRAGGGAAARLSLQRSTWPIDHLPDLLNRIGEVPPDASRVSIELGDFAYASALAVIAQWLLHNGFADRYDVECGKQMAEYLDRVRFRAALRNREIKVSPDFMDWAVGLTRINRDLASEAVTEKIVDIIDTFINPTKEARQALQTLIAEMIENVHRHAGASEDGFAVAQVYPRRLKMGITLVEPWHGDSDQPRGELGGASRGCDWMGRRYVPS